MYTAIVTPFEIAFLKPEVDVLFFVGNVFNLIFIIDMILQFFLHYEMHTEYGQMMEGNHEAIIKNYLYGNFFADFISSVPWGLVVQFSSAGGGLAAFRLLRLLRLLKLLRVLRGSRLVEKYRAEVSFSFAYITLCMYVGSILLFSHWVACLWAYAASADKEDGYTGWIAHDDFGFDESSPYKRYVVSLYFAIMVSLYSKLEALSCL